MGNILWNCPLWRSSETAPLQKVDNKDVALLELKVQRDRLKEYQKRSKYVIQRETEVARQLFKAGKRKQALLALKKKKYQEQLLEKSEALLANVQEMVDSIEFARLEAQVFDGLKLGTRTLQELNREMSLEAVERLMDETQEALEYQREIESALASQLRPEDEAAVEAELEELQREEEQQREVALAERLPSAPTTALPESVPVLPAPPIAATTTAAPARARMPAADSAATLKLPAS